LRHAGTLDRERQYLHPGFEGVVRPKFLRPQNNPKIKAGWFGRATPSKQTKIGSGVGRPQNKLKLVRACNALKTN